MKVTPITPMSPQLSTVTSLKSSVQAFDGFEPKAKFLYAVRFNFNANGGSDISGSFTFLIKKFDRPKISIEHTKVNMYGFRTTIPKTIIYTPFKIDIHDDIKNSTLNFVVAYLRRISPLFNQPNSARFESNGLQFDNSSASYSLYNPLGYQYQQDSTVNLIDSIQVMHLHNYGKNVDTYTFLRPKVVEIIMDELDMSASTDGSSISLEFEYDGLNIDVGAKADGIANTLEALYRASYTHNGAADIGSRVDALEYTNLIKPQTEMTVPNPNTNLIPEGIPLLPNANIPALDTIAANPETTSATNTPLQIKPTISNIINQAGFFSSGNKLSGTNYISGTNTKAIESAKPNYASTFIANR